jgi:hypothetical protein
MKVDLLGKMSGGSFWQSARQFWRVCSTLHLACRRGAGKTMSQHWCASDMKSIPCR